jgi:hypothetical protein
MHHRQSAKLDEPANVLVISRLLGNADAKLHAPWCLCQTMNFIAAFARSAFAANTKRSRDVP